MMVEIFDEFLDFFFFDMRFLEVARQNERKDRLRVFKEDVVGFFNF